MEDILQNLQVNQSNLYALLFHNNYLTVTRGFSGGSVVNSVNLLKASSGAVNALPAPVEKEVPYGDL